MNVIQIKDDEQRKALNSWAKAGYKGSVIAGTGFGKSRVGVMALAHAIKHDTTKAKALVLVPTTQLQDQFKEEVIKWGHEKILSRVEIICYQSAHKILAESYCIVVCDEIHLGLSPIYRKFFDKNTYDKILCLTATLPEDDEYKGVLLKLAPPVYTLSLDQCVAKGLVADYQIYCVPVQLTETERVTYKKHHNLFVQMKYKLGGFNAFQNAQLIISGTMSGDKGAAAMFYRAIRGRKEVVQHAMSKILETKEIVDNYSDTKILTFSGSNNFTDQMSDFIEGSVVYHSKKTKKQREKALEDFREGDVNVLCSTKALNQGFDVKGAEVGIIAGLESKALPMIQRIGRLIRKDGDKIGKIYILYVQDSQEEKWLNNAIKGLNNINRDIDLTTHFNYES
jgi:superfamily II DNA or RNA helicase